MTLLDNLCHLARKRVKVSQVTLIKQVTWFLWSLIPHQETEIIKLSLSIWPDFPEAKDRLFFLKELHKTVKRKVALFHRGIPPLWAFNARLLTVDNISASNMHVCALIWGTYFTSQCPCVQALRYTSVIFKHTNLNILHVVQTFLPIFNVFAFS